MNEGILRRLIELAFNVPVEIILAFNYVGLVRFSDQTYGCVKVLISAEGHEGGYETFKDIETATHWFCKEASNAHAH